MLEKMPSGTDRQSWTTHNYRHNTLHQQANTNNTKQHKPCAHTPNLKTPTNQTRLTKSQHKQHNIKQTTRHTNTTDKDTSHALSTINRKETTQPTTAKETKATQDKQKICITRNEHNKTETTISRKNTTSTRPRHEQKDTLGKTEASQPQLNANEKQPDQWTHMQLTDDDAFEPVHPPRHNKTEITNSRKITTSTGHRHVRKIHSVKQKPQSPK